MSGLNLMRADVYFQEAARDLRRIASRLRACRMAALFQAAHNNEEAAAIAHFAQVITSRNDLGDKLESIWDHIPADDCHKPQSALNRMDVFLRDNWLVLDMPAGIKDEHIRPAIVWLIWFLYERGRGGE
jgi:hypothetical protein